MKDKNVAPSRLPLAELLTDYPPGTAVIRYRNARGWVVDWFVGAAEGVDNEQTLREHLAEWHPDAVFLDWMVQ